MTTYLDIEYRPFDKKVHDSRRCFSSPLRQLDLQASPWINRLCEDKQLSHQAGSGPISASLTSLEALGLWYQLVMYKSYKKNARKSNKNDNDS